MTTSSSTQNGQKNQQHVCLQVNVLHMYALFCCCKSLLSCCSFLWSTHIRLIKGHADLAAYCEYVTVHLYTMELKVVRTLTPLKQGTLQYCGGLTAGCRLGQTGADWDGLVSLLEPVSTAVLFENTPTLLQCAGAQNWCWMTPLFLLNPPTLTLSCTSHHHRPRRASKSTSRFWVDSPTGNISVWNPAGPEENVMGQWSRAQ